MPRDGEKSEVRVVLGRRVRRRGARCPDRAGSRFGIIGLVVFLVATLLTGCGGTKRGSFSVYSYTAISCPSVKVCFAGGYDAVTQASMILSTTDGGTHWSHRSRTISPYNISGISCPDTTHCVATSDTKVFATSDGGATWTEKPTIGSTPIFEAIACTDSTRCFATGYAALPHSSDIMNSSGIDFVTATTDGGSTWTAKFARGAGNGVILDYSSISCPTADTCLVGGFNSAVSNGPNQAISLRTQDAGATWTTGSAPVGLVDPSLSRDVVVLGVSCSTPVDCVATGSIKVTSPSAGAVSFVTHDGGATWASHAFIGVGYDFNAVSCPDRLHCFAVSDPGRYWGSIFASADGGATWVAQTGGVLAVKNQPV